jgi:hypothetical protein
MRSSRAINRVRTELRFNVSETASASASEKLDCISILTRLIDREDFIAFSRLESYKSYTYSFCWKHLFYTRNLSSIRFHKKNVTSFISSKSCI